jgi:hypothetical protein
VEPSLGIWNLYTQTERDDEGERDVRESDGERRRRGVVFKGAGDGLVGWQEDYWSGVHQAELARLVENCGDSFFVIEFDA